MTEQEFDAERDAIVLGEDVTPFAFTTDRDGNGMLCLELPIDIIAKLEALGDSQGKDLGEFVHDVLKRLPARPSARR